MLDTEAVIAAAVHGDSIRTIAGRHECSIAAVKEVLDQHAKEMLSPAARAAALALEIRRLELLEQHFMRVAIEQSDANAGTLVCKLVTRKSALLGLDQPKTLTVDLSAVDQHKDGQSSTFRMLQAIRALRGEPEPEPSEGDAGEEPDKLN